MKSSVFALAALAGVSLLVTACTTEIPPASVDEPGADVSTGTDPESNVGATSAALTGSSCTAMINDDVAYCGELGSFGCIRYISGTSYLDPYCVAAVKNQCKDASWGPFINCDATGSAEVFRVRNGSVHYETKVYTAGVAEAKFIFSAKPAAGASPNPIYRCRLNSKWTPIRDFPSRDPNCEGHGPAISVLGYDWPTSKTGVKPVYRCRTDVAFSGVDHFLSWSSTCEGKVKESLIGYAY